MNMLTENTESAETFVQANGVRLCAQTFGNPTDPAILLMHGAGSSMLWWEDEFCQALASGSRFVIRYDFRDTGRSVSYEPGAPPYSVRDLAADALGLLDAYALDRAHLVGMSMGGAIAMLMALAAPDRVASLTLISATPGGADLPEMAEEFVARISAAESPDWSDREAVIAYSVAMLRLLAGGSPYFDEAATRDLVARDIDRTVNLPASVTNHHVIDEGDPIRDRLREIAVPTLVIHGALDPMLPLAHGQALAEIIPGAELLTLEETGHELPRAVWNIVVPAILRHTARRDQIRNKG